MFNGSGIRSRDGRAEDPRSAAREPRASPAHHGPDGGFRNPGLEWPRASGGAVLRWQWERLRRGVPPNPAPHALPVVPGDVAYPRAARGELRITWVGHSTFLIQLGGLNLLTDPIWSRRASPVQWAGPARLVPPGLPFDQLPPVDAVLVSHDHFDHLDRPTVVRLRRTFGDAPRWVTPLGYRPWLARIGVRNVAELDWWQSTSIETPAGALRVTALPAQHWSRRSLVGDGRRLWASYAVETPDGFRLYFGGDTGYFGGFAEIGSRLGPFDAVILPIGAYEPRWFMRPVHMDPGDAVRAYQDLGGRGAFVPMHWGTFRLSDEDPLEPPQRLAAAWREAGLPAEDLWILRHGETRLASTAGRPGE